MLDGSHGSNVTGVHSSLLLMAGPSFCTISDLGLSKIMVPPNHQF